MSISVEHERVRAEAEERGPGAFLLTVTDDGRPHAVAVTVGWDGGSIVMDVGRSSARNAGDRPGVTVLWPPAEPGGYSFIVDGDAVASAAAEGAGGRVTVQPTAAVLHRPGPPGPGPGCTADCVPVLRT